MATLTTKRWPAFWPMAATKKRSYSTTGLTKPKNGRTAICVIPTAIRPAIRRAVGRESPWSCSPIESNDRSADEPKTQSSGRWTMAENDNQQKPRLWQRIKTSLTLPDTPVGARTFALTLRILVTLVVIYALAHAGSLIWAGHLHTEQSALDADRMAMLLDTAQLKDQLLTPPALADPAIGAVLDALERSVMIAEDADAVAALFGDTVTSLVSLGVPQSEPQSSVVSATTHITELLGGARAEAEALVAAGEKAREIPLRLLRIELEQARAAILDYVAVPTLSGRVAGLDKAAQSLGYGPKSDIIGTLTRISEELRKDQPNRALAAEMLDRIRDEIQGVRKSLFWRDPVLLWLEVIAWSLAGILATRLMSAGRYIGTHQFKPEWDRWWWAKIVLAPLMAIPIVAFLTYLTIDVQSRDTLGIQVSLKDQPIEVVISFAFIIGMFSNQAYKFLQNMAAKILPEDDDDAKAKPAPIAVEETPIAGRPADEVQAELEKRGFKIKIETEVKPTAEAAPGTVLGRKPDDKELAKGAGITLIVAEAPEG
ncbi:MAG: PASTA domain-containing protein [Gemmatimonadales bacterium]|nr:MAG: PASTA domain-containing protein [Gemmatimonadales bacterium]